MPLDKARAQQYLRTCQLDKLFVEELGWDRHAASLPIEVNGTVFTLTALAEKRGLVAYRCAPDSQGHIPEYKLRRQIDR